MLIKRVYEIDSLTCPNCGGTMKVVALLEPPQADVIEKILRHCGLWHATRAPPGDNGFVRAPDGHSQADSDAPWDLTFVADRAIWGEAAGFREADTFGHDPVDAWYRHLAEDEPRDLTYVDEDTRLAALPLLQLLDSPILCEHDEDAWEIKFPITNTREEEATMSRAISCHVILCAAVSTASAATYYVSPAGDDGNSGASESEPFRVVQHAVDQMNSGDVLVVLDGVYAGELKLKSGITLKAKNPRKVVFSGAEPIKAHFERHSGKASREGRACRFLWCWMRACSCLTHWSTPCCGSRTRAPIGRCGRKTSWPRPDEP